MGRFTRDWMLEDKVSQTNFKANASGDVGAFDRGSRRQAARHDALDLEECAGRQGQELRAGRGIGWPFSGPCVWTIR